MPQIIAAVGAAMTAVAVGIGKALTAFGVSAYTAGVIGGLAVKYGVQIAIVWATSKLLAPKLDNVGARQADVLELSLGEHPREAIFGRAATGGTLMDAFNWGGSQNDWEAMVIALADHECHALVGFYVDDKYVAHVGNGNVSGYSDSNGAALQVFFLPGTMTQTLPGTVGAGPNAMSFVSASGGRWTADDRLLGVAAVIVCYRFTPEILGGRPSFRWVIDGKKCYDPRKDSTVTGGSGLHRWNDPTTHEWTENAALCRYNYLRGVYTNGQLILGPGRTAEEAPPEDVIAAANLCDENVTLKAGGTVKRYTVSAVVRADEPWIDVEEAFAAAMGAELIERSGIIVIDPGAAKTVAKTFTDADLLEDFPVEVQAKLSRRDLVNTVTASYVDPAQMYEEQTAPIRRLLADITADGETRDRPLALRFVTSANQAQRLGEIERRKARLQRTANVCLGPRYSVLEVGDWVTWQGSIYNALADRTYMVISAAVDDAQRITLGLREIASSVYSWTPASDELDVNVPSFVAPTPPDGWSTGSNNVLWSDIFGTGRPADNATVNRVFAQASAPAGAVDGDVWHDTDANPQITYYRVGGAWVTGPNLATNTNQLTDGAQLGSTAIWAQVSGTGRPADNATVGARTGVNLRNTADTVTLGDGDVITAQGTAADFAGRQWGATATEGQASNARVPLGSNSIINSEFARGIYAWAPIWNGSTGAGVAQTIEGTERRALRAAATGSWPNGGAFEIGCGGPDSRYWLPVKAGDRVFASALLAFNSSCLTAQVNIHWYNRDGVYLGEVATNGGAANSSPGNDPANYSRVTHFATAPANAAFANLRLRAGTNGGASPVAWAMEAMLCLVEASQTQAPLYVAGRADVIADQTSANTAADFTGRGVLATLNSAAWGSHISGRPTELTDGRVAAGLDASGDIARNLTEGRLNSSNVLRRSSGGLYTGDLAATVGARAGTNLFRTDGSTVMTQAEVRTAEGTAADFVGRGPWATQQTPVLSLVAPNPNLFPFPSPIYGNYGGSYPDPSSYGWQGAAIGIGYWQAAGGPIYYRPRGAGGPAADEYHFFDIPNAIAGQPYTVSLNGYMSGGNFYPYVECLNGSKTIISAHPLAYDGTSHRYRVTFTAPANTAFIRLVVLASYPAATGYQDVVFSRIKVEHGNEMTPFSSAPEVTPRQSGADVTGSNTAADFAGRQWGATATEGQASNARVPLGENQAVNSDFIGSFPPLGWVTGWDGNGGAVVTRSIIQQGARRALKGVASNTPANGTVWDIAANSEAISNGVFRYLLPCRPGDRVLAAARVASINASGCAVYVAFRNAAGTNIGESSTSGWLGSGVNGDSTDVASWPRASMIVTAPAGAVAANMFVRVLASGAAAGAGWMAEPVMAILPAGQTEIPPYTPGPVDRLADRTGDNTAADFAGRQWGATATEGQASNARVPVGENQAVNSEFFGSFPPLGWVAGWDGNGGASVTRSVITRGGRRAIKGAVSNTPANGTVWDIAITRNDLSLGVQRYAMPCKAGDCVAAAARVAALNSTGAVVFVIFLDAAGNNIGDASASSWIGAGTNGDSVDVVSWPRSSVIATAPANAASVTVFVRVLASGAASAAAWMAEPLLAILPAGQTEIPPYAPGPVDRLADQTSSNTAADFSGRGALATANYYRQASDPGAVPDGSLWTDTSVTPNVLRQRISGVWQTLATANTVAAQLYATVSPKARVKTRSGTGSATTDTVTVTASGGSGGYTYAWTQQAGSSATATAATSATTAFQYTLVGLGEENVTTWECVVTDSAGAKASALVRAVFVETS